jgi:hypothetical protein
MFKLKVKQVRVVTYVLGAVAAILLGVLGFRFLGEYLTAKASDSAPKNLSITDITSNSAVVKWSTDQESQVVIEYGTTATALTFFAPEATRTKQHRVELNLLTEATTYYFQVKSGDKIFDNGGVPWTFTTLAAGEETDKEKEATDAAEIETTVEPTEKLTTTNEPEPTSSPSATVSSSPSPTTDPATVTKDTECDLETYKTYFYTDNAEYDQDDNGVVNLRDWSLCSAKLTVTPTEEPAP